MTRIIVVGAGGHGQVVADAILAAAAGGASVSLAGFVDADPARAGSILMGVPILGLDTALAGAGHDAIVIAVGSNAQRARLARELATRGQRFAAVVHPAAVLGYGVTVAEGAMIMAGVVVNTAASIGAHAILNTCCSVDHHNSIGACAHIAPGARLGGDVRIGEGAMIGIGSAVLPQRSIGDWAIVGGGALVASDVAPRATVMGVPAREPERRG